MREVTREFSAEQPDDLPQRLAGFLHCCFEATTVGVLLPEESHRLVGDISKSWQGDTEKTSPAFIVCPLTSHPLQHKAALAGTFLQVGGSQLASWGGLKRA